MSETVKAYGCNDYHREKGCVVFATTPGKARASAACELDSEFIDLEVRRAPDFDALAPGPVTVRQYVERGWRFQCHASGCYRWCYVDDGAVLEEEAVYCSAQCASAEAIAA